MESEHHARDNPTLMTLPRELRDDIWAFSVVDPWPIQAITDVCDIYDDPPPKTSTPLQQLRQLALDAIGSPREHRPGVARRSSILPRLPPLAHVSRQVRVEALSAFAGNLFVFSQQRPSGSPLGDYKVRDWQMSTLMQKVARDSDVDFFIRWRVRVDVDIVQAPLARQWKFSSATISLNSARRLVVVYTGGLAEQCTCRYRKVAECLGDVAKRNGSHSESIMKFACFLRFELRESWQRREGLFEAKVADRCADCGLDDWDNVPSRNREEYAPGNLTALQRADFWPEGGMMDLK
ncbi:hypothetical protein LTR97_009918 [Elasticomyces elasticus]|uniref:Uncharacterized protein n=1 Tax=Elasticomyces elasticus TaxID=574655 RepID=A0AAN7VP86_9PEZI|nr:hypothetical protein LTR97_009918 [Elasticomyces elasticus]